MEETIATLDDVIEEVFVIRKNKLSILLNHRGSQCAYSCVHWDCCQHEVHHVSKTSSKPCYGSAIMLNAGIICSRQAPTIPEDSEGMRSSGMVV